MARDAPPSLDQLIGLGARRLAELALDEAGSNAAFRQRLAAAIAAARGPAAVAAIVDRRLAALEKGRSTIAAARRRAFVEDLSATLKIIADDLAGADPASAVERLLRLLAAADGALARAGDEAAGVFSAAAAALPALLARLPGDDGGALADGLYALAADSRSAFVLRAAADILAAAPAATVAALDARLAEGVLALGPLAGDPPNWSLRARARRLIELRQRIADRRGDVDAYIALATALPGEGPDVAAIGERLVGAGRAAEALAWLRRSAPPSIKRLSLADLHVGLPPRDPAADRRAHVEIAALEALGDNAAAQALRWRLFTETLDADILREQVARLPDFEDVEALDAAFAAVFASPMIAAALRFFLQWPRLDLAERLVVERRTEWDGRRCEALAPAADALESRHPLAAVVLYRALLDAILDRGLSLAYGRAARYYAALQGLEAREAPGWPIEPHRHYRAELRRRHGRKLGFWSRVEAAGAT
ncbi:hypothetical protein DFR50_109102 [Roseiarcus fermentans]|uniref:Uncharacterized protein n=1 Tax=Roseiarcus fermentans TaxID=1473586 RepID=A0A366FKV7_9HYPH|nr:DUF6880 family protein [Roseiarcus fermentans]RBP14349.1 hypothetical protein DFR50_109102 [Roseiarcus fermentans]